MKRIVVPGDPVPWERAGARIAGKPPKQWIEFYPPKQTRVQETTIAAAWQAEHGLVKLTGPLKLSAAFAFARPSGHFGTGRNASTVKPQHLSASPGGRGNRNADDQRTGGDLDNLLKLVCDALNDVAYVDDGQLVAFGEVTKFFVDQGGLAAPATMIGVEPFSGALL